MASKNLPCSTRKIGNLKIAVSINKLKWFGGCNTGCGEWEPIHKILHFYVRITLLNYNINIIRLHVKFCKIIAHEAAEDYKNMYQVDYWIG